ncbi:M23 family metallopeptidase [Microbacterium sp. A93]|uniref:M23 family metallopeptidase n=1 Tax=Microbacterium sp. A93 TaxID=3450716 RepID=UPI003F41ECC5
MRRALIAVYRLRIPGYYASTATLIAVALSTFLTLGETARQARGILSPIALCVLAICIVLAFTAPVFLPKRETVKVSSPVRGRWLAMNSPASKVPSHGVRAYGQTYAIDLVNEPVDKVRPPFGGGSAMRAPSEYPAFGAPVFAMCDGVVVRASDWRRDHRARSNLLAVIYLLFEGAIRESGGPGFIVGNHVTIRGADGVHATVAHLQRGSVTVRVGETVRAGEQIGLCGNSGNSTEPHVHAQLMDRASLWTAIGVPMTFAGITIGDAPELADTLPQNNEHLTTRA